MGEIHTLIPAHSPCLKKSAAPPSDSQVRDPRNARHQLSKQKCLKPIPSLQNNCWTQYMKASQKHPRLTFSEWHAWRVTIFFALEEAGSQEDQAHDPRGTFGRWSHCRGVGNAGDFADQIGRWAASPLRCRVRMCELRKRICMTGYLLYGYILTHFCTHFTFLCFVFFTLSLYVCTGI